MFATRIHDNRSLITATRSSNCERSTPTPHPTSPACLRQVPPREHCTSAGGPSFTGPFICYTSKSRTSPWPPAGTTRLLRRRRAAQRCTHQWRQHEHPELPQGMGICFCRLRTQQDQFSISQTQLHSHVLPQTARPAPPQPDLARQHWMHSHPPRSSAKALHSFSQRQFFGSRDASSDRHQTQNTRSIV